MSITVPWNAAWSAEVGRYEVRPCRWAGGKMALWQPHAPGQGRPLFAQPHGVRQRRSVAQMLCTVCGQPTPRDDRWAFPLGDRREIDGKARWLTTETPVHRACADHAMEVCPHLRGRGLRPSVFPDVWAVTAVLIGGPEVERDFGVTIGRHEQVVGAMKLILPDWWVSLATAVAP